MQHKILIAYNSKYLLSSWICRLGRGQLIWIGLSLVSAVKLQYMGWLCFLLQVLAKLALHVSHPPWSSHRALSRKASSSHGNGRGARIKQKYLYLSFGLSFSFLLPLMQAGHIVEPNFKGRKYILAIMKPWQVRVKNWNSWFNLPQECEKIKDRRKARKWSNDKWGSQIAKGDNLRGSGHLMTLSLSD